MRHSAGAILLDIEKSQEEIYNAPDNLNKPVIAVADVFTYTLCKTDPGEEMTLDICHILLKKQKMYDTILSDYY